jgi:uncharacterized protein (DUF2062 family)
MESKYFFKKSKSKIKNYFKKIIVLKMTPQEIALGFSAGSLIALLPTFGLAYFVGLGIIFVIPKINKISLFLGITFWNPLILAPIYSYSYKLGIFIMGDLPDHTFNLSLSSKIIKISFRFIIGNFIISLSISVFVYFVVLIIFKYFNFNKNKRKIK